MHKLVMFIVLSFIGCVEKVSDFKSLNKPVISLIVDGVFEDKSFGESAWQGIQMLKKNFEVEVFGKDSIGKSYISDLEAFKDKGSSVIWGVGYRFQEAI